MDKPGKNNVVRANVDVLLFPVPLRNPAGANCLNCDSLLSLSQPDLDMPDRLIGVCEKCKHWFLIDLIPHEGEGIISVLPDSQVIRTRSRRNYGEGISVRNCDSEETLIQPKKPVDAETNLPS